PMPLRVSQICWKGESELFGPVFIMLRDYATPAPSWKPAFATSLPNEFIEVFPEDLCRSHFVSKLAPGSRCYFRFGRGRVARMLSNSLVKRFADFGRHECSY